MSEAQEQFLSVSVVAKRLRCSEMSVIRYLESGLLRGYQMKPRGWWRIIASSVTEFERRIAAECGDGAAVRMR